MKTGSWLIKILSLVPYLVSGIEQIHGETKSGVEKKQLAMDSLGFATNAAMTLDPNDKEAIQAAQALASVTIDGVKAVYNAVKPKPVAVARAVPSPAPPPVASVPGEMRVQPVPGAVSAADFPAS
jgi:hypothetical protein